MRFQLLPAMFAAALVATGATANDNLNAAVGGALGGGFGAMVGNELGGRTGAIVGGALGSAAGAAVTTSPDRADHHGQDWDDDGPSYRGRYGRGGKGCPPGLAMQGRCR